MAGQLHANEGHNQQRHDLLERLVIPIVVTVVGALSAATLSFLFARGSIDLAFGLWGFVAVVLVVVAILATARERHEPMWARVKGIPVWTVLALLVAAAVGFGVGWLAFGNHKNRAAYIGHIVQWVNGGGQPNTSWLVGNNGKRYWIPNTSIFSCLVKEGHTDLGPQSSAVLYDLPDSGYWASCPATVNRAAYIGHIVQWVNGGGQNTSWLVGNNGKRYWIPTTSIFSCLVKERHTDLGSQSSTVLDDLPDSRQWASCPATVNRAAYIGHIVEWFNGGGQPNPSWLVGNNGERYWIPTTSIYSCLVRKGHTDKGPQSSAVLDDLPDLGQWASC